MERLYKVTPEKAYLYGGWSDELCDLLATNRPPSIELAGDWSDLSVFDGLVDGVERLKIAGSLKNGEIKAAHGLGVFSGIKRLTLVSKVKAGLDTSALLQLEYYDGPWQQEILALLAGPNLSDATIRAIPQEALLVFPENHSLSRLWLANPSASSLQGIGALRRLDSLQITYAKKLETLSGLESCPLAELDITSARQLVDFSALRMIPTIRRLRILDVAQEADITPFADIPGLRWLLLAGKGVPQVDWLAMMSLPEIESISGWWDPAQVSEQAIRAAVSDTRRVVKFEPLSKAKIRPLAVTLADAA